MAVSTEPLNQLIQPYNQVVRYSREILHTSAQKQKIYLDLGKSSPDFVPDRIEHQSKHFAYNTLESVTYK